MRHCWRDRPHDRPTFEQLNIALTKLADAHKVNTALYAGPILKMILSYGVSWLSG